LELGAAGSFAGTIIGFSGSDAIDVLNTAVTGLSYSGTSTSGTLTVSGSGGTIAELKFSGDYTTASFALASDGHGGTDIIDPPYRRLRATAPTRLSLRPSSMAHSARVAPTPPS
jgi:hypothetical protein